MRKLWAAALLSVALIACKKVRTDPNPPTPVASDEFVVTVTLDQDHPGYYISPIFEGLSFETALLSTNPEFLNANNSVLVQLVKNLGPGILRIGGNTSDKIEWSATGTSPDSLIKSAIDRLSTFSGATGWPVLFGLNLGSNNVNAALNEAQYVYNSLGSNLYAFHTGNEPDVYNMFGLRPPEYNYNSFMTEWDNYFSAIRSQLPHAAFAGPDAANHTDWITSFADTRASKVKLIDGHYYLIGPASDPSITYHSLVESSALPPYLSALNTGSSKYSLPYRITECNSVYGGGKAGVSDVFAAALWALDFMWIVAENNGQGINFHGGTGLFYSPISNDNGAVTAKPEYYGMLAFKYGNAGGSIIPATLSDHQYNCQAYAAANADNTYSVTLINKEEYKDIAITIQLSKPASTVQVSRLSAPSLTASAGITFAGSTVNNDGSFTPGKTEQLTINQSSVVVHVPAGSAAVVNLQ